MADQPEAPLSQDRALLGRAMDIARAVKRTPTLWREEPFYRVYLRRRLLAPSYRRRFHHFGEKVTLDKPLWLYGTKYMSIGDGSIILRGAWLAVEREAWQQPAPVLEIGRRFAARPFVTISAAGSVVIEDNVGVASFSTIIDSDHTWSEASTHVLDSGLSATPIRIGEGTFIAERAAILGGAQIGRQCFIGANTVVKGRVPDYSIVLGVPGRVVGSTRPEASRDE
ncbi:MAG TPA: acyltransferase [Mycobacteriales bacterium]|nr:acyltransferase [Mycobacteriales bacterium]